MDWEVASPRPGCAAAKGQLTLSGPPEKMLRTLIQKSLELWGRYKTNAACVKKSEGKKSAKYRARCEQKVHASEKACRLTIRETQEGKRGTVAVEKKRGGARRHSTGEK